MTSTDLTVSLEPTAIQARINYAKALAGSNLLPAQYQHQPANALVAIETGYALGIAPIQALSSIAVINGRACMSADLMAAVVRRAGHKLRIEERDGAVKATLIRRDDPDYEFTVVWDREKATTAGLWGRKGPWTQFPTQMLRARAITEVCRQGASDALMGVIYAPEELGADVDADGNVVATPTPQPAQPAQSAVLEGEQRQRVLSEIKALLTKASCDTSTAEVILAMAVAAGAVGSPDDLRAWMRQAWRENALPLVHLGEVEPEDQAEQPTLDGEVIEAGETA